MTCEQSRVHCGGEKCLVGQLQGVIQNLANEVSRLHQTVEAHERREKLEAYKNWMWTVAGGAISIASGVYIFTTLLGGG
jgi:hypothetical protein